jgi:hypothetical protein
MAVDAVKSPMVGGLDREPDEIGPAAGSAARVAAPVARSIAAFIDPFERTLADLFALNVLLQIVDGLLTYRAIQLGFREGNPLLVASFVAIGPMSTLFLFKAKACALLLLVRRSASPAFGVLALRGTALGYALFAIVPWIGKLCAFALVTLPPL